MTCAFRSSGSCSHKIQSYALFLQADVRDLPSLALPWPACGCARAAVLPTAARRLRSEHSRPEEVAEEP